MNELYHHGVKGMKWGVWNEETARRHGSNKRSVFISGSSKTQDPSSAYYRPELNKDITQLLDRYMNEKVQILVGDAPGIDRQVQNYFNDKGYNNVVVYGPGKKVRYSANEKWETRPIDAPEYEEYSKEWLAKKDIAMEKAATEGLAIILDEGAKATRKNVERLIADNKNVSVYQLNSSGEDSWNKEMSKGMRGS